MTTWQYTTAQFITHGLGDDEAAADLEAELNRLGADGWELATGTLYRSAEAACDVLLLTFKRLTTGTGRLRTLATAPEPVRAPAPDPEPPR